MDGRTWNRVVHLTLSLSLCVCAELWRAYIDFVCTCPADTFPSTTATEPPTDHHQHQQQQQQPAAPGPSQRYGYSFLFGLLNTAVDEVGATPQSFDLYAALLSLLVRIYNSALLQVGRYARPSVRRTHKAGTTNAAVCVSFSPSMCFS